MNEYRPLGNTLFPPVVKNLMIINGIMFLAMGVFAQAFGWDLTSTLGLHYFESDKFRVWQIFTHLFMHGNLGHIFSNMFSLWMFGSVLENYLGGQRFLQFYIITGIGAAILHSAVQYFEFHSMIMAAESYAAHPNIVAFRDFVNSHAPGSINTQLTDFIYGWNMHPQQGFVTESVDIVNTITNAQINVATVGASGAVFGLLFAFGYLYPNSLIYVYFALPIKAKYFVILYGLFELFAGISNMDNVAHYAHLGGMLFGFLLFRFWKVRRPMDFF